MFYMIIASHKIVRAVNITVIIIKGIIKISLYLTNTDITSMGPLYKNANYIIDTLNNVKKRPLPSVVNVIYAKTGFISVF